MSFFSCFACGGQSNTTITNPTPVASSKVIPSDQLNQTKISIGQEYQDNKSRSGTTLTFFTSDSAPSSIEDEQSYIRKKIQQMRKKDLPQRKAMQSEFIRQNLTKSTTVYLVQKEWSELYTAFLKQIETKQLRSINNSRLFDHKNNLRGDIREKEDYFIINERVWKFVQLMYGGGPAIVQDLFFPVVSLSNRKLEIPVVGMVNPLNLCYMIAVLQCLISNQHFANYFSKKMYEDNKKKMICHSLVSKVIKNMSDTKSPKIEIKQFSAYFQSTFNAVQQHDSHQFFIKLCNTLQEQITQQSNQKNMNAKDPQTAYTNYFRNNKSIIDRLFVGQIETVVQCSRCPLKSTSYTAFLDIQLEISDVTLQGCLKRHFDSEKIDDYECQKCNKKTKAFKKEAITKTPNYLVLTLKKFTKTGKKVEDRVKYPLQLNLKPLCRGHYGQSRYLLQSVLVHKGVKSTKGHYYCYTHRLKKPWHYASDDLTKEIQQQQALGRDAYMLFYQRLK